MTFGECALHQIWESVYATFVHAVQEEGCAGAVLGKCVEDLGCVDVWPIVKRQGNCARDCAVVNHSAEWYRGEGRRGWSPRCIVGPWDDGS